MLNRKPFILLALLTSPLCLNASDFSISDLDKIKAINEIKEEQAKKIRLELQIEKLNSDIQKIRNERYSESNTQKGINSSTLSVSERFNNLCLSSVHGTPENLYADIVIDGVEVKNVQKSDSIINLYTILDVSYINGRPSVFYSDESQIKTKALPCVDNNISKINRSTPSFARPL